MEAIKKNKVDSLEAHIKALESIVERQQEQIFRLTNIIDNLPGSIYWKDTHGVYLGRNTHAAERMREHNLEINPTADNIIGKTDYDFFTKPIADNYRKHDLEVMQTGKELILEEELTLPTGETITQLSYKKPQYDKSGKLTGLVGNTVDITYLKKIESELRLAKEKAESANEIKMEFIRNMEHDIRTPFSGIWGMAKILQEQEEDPQKKEFLSDITNCAKELLDYCNGILDFSKIELGSLAITQTKFSLHTVIEKIYAIELPAAKFKNLELIIDIDSNIPSEITGDEYRLLRLLLNLVSNAIKFTHQGKVMIKVDCIQNTNKKILLKFIIQDTGIGIEKDKQEFIYEKFSRIKPSYTGKYKGLGLGLRIVKQFIAEMGGEIQVMSKPDIGSTFVCLLPFGDNYE